MGEMYKQFLPFYKKYQDHKNYLSFKGFLKFCYDFDIFPSLINKQKLNEIFSAMSSLFKNNKHNENSIVFDSESEVEFDIIDQHLFIEALSLCSMYIYTNEENPIFRVTIFY